MTKRPFKEAETTKTTRVKGSALDAKIQIILLENVQSHQKTRTKDHSLEVLGAIAVKKMMKRYKTRHVKRIENEAKTVREVATDGQSEHDTCHSACVSPRARLDMSTAYHPQTDGQSDRTIQTLEDMLRLLHEYIEVVPDYFDSFFHGLSDIGRLCFWSGDHRAFQQDYPAAP
ncbi:UBN2 domain-containing protein [Tanacetum coccineum]